MPESQTIVLVPGFLGGRFSLAPLREELSNRGHGAQAWARAPLLYRHSLATYAESLAEDVVTLRRQIGQPLTVFGWSMGGLVSVETMRILTERFENAHTIVGKVIAFGSPFHGAWAGYPATIFDHLLRLNAREMRPGHPTLSALARFLEAPRAWRFHAIHGANDWLVRPAGNRLNPDWCHQGPFNHRAPLYDPNLFDLIHRLILAP